MLLISEGERTIQFCGILSSEDRRPSIGYGYDVDKKDNNKETQKEGFCREFNFVSSIKGDYSEAGAVEHLEVSKLTENVQRVVLVVFDFRTRKEILVSNQCENVLIEMEVFRIFRKEFERVRVLVWLVMFLFKLMAVVMSRSRRFGGMFVLNNGRMNSGCIESIDVTAAKGGILSHSGHNRGLPGILFQDPFALESGTIPTRRLVACCHGSSSCGEQTGPEEKQ
jgi:hypothetical protein